MPHCTLAVPVPSHRTCWLALSHSQLPCDVNLNKPEITSIFATVGDYQSLPGKPRRKIYHGILNGLHTSYVIRPCTMPNSSTLNNKPNIGQSDPPAEVGKTNFGREHEWSYCLHHMAPEPRYRNCTNWSKVRYCLTAKEVDGLITLRSAWFFNFGNLRKIHRY